MYLMIQDTIVCGTDRFVYSFTSVRTIDLTFTKKITVSVKILYLIINDLQGILDLDMEPVLWQKKLRKNEKTLYINKDKSK